jgi:hypothetical protein
MARKKAGSQTVEWLKRLYEDLSGGHIEVRFRSQDGDIVKREWCSTFERVDTLVRDYGDKDSKLSAYYGVAKRTDESKQEKKGTKEHVLGTTTLWADIDTAKHGWDLQKTARALYDLPLVLQPSALVKSGGGLHAYWFLKEPVRFERPEDTANVEDANKALGIMCSGDRIFDITRVLRLPGSHNARWKKPVETLFNFHWSKKCPHELMNAEMDFGKVLGPDGFVLPEDMPTEYRKVREYDLESVLRMNFGGGSKSRIKREEQLWENTRPGGGYPYYGINEAELMSTCNLYFMYGQPDWKQKREAIIDDVFRKVEKVMERYPAEARGWNWDAEEDAIADKLDRWHAQWAVLLKKLKKEKKEAKRG